MTPRPPRPLLLSVLASALCALLAPPLRAEGPAGPPEELTRPAAKAPAPAAKSPAPSSAAAQTGAAPAAVAPPAAKSPAPPGTTAPAVATPAARPPAPVVVPTQGQALLLWAAPLEPLPAELARAAEASQIAVLPPGALAFTAQTLLKAREAIAALRCGEAIPALEEAEGRLLAEVGVEDARPLIAPLETLLLLCADRLGDEVRARRAAARLQMARSGGAPAAELPAEAALVLRRYASPGLFGPPLPPTRVETDPPGAAVIRNLSKIGTSPQVIAGGDPARDLLDVELPGYRKVHRALGTGEQIALGLRNEDRLSVLLDAAAARPFGGADQGAALAVVAGALGPRPLLVVTPSQQGGRAAAGERLQVRVYDPEKRAWRGAAQEVSAGPPGEQAARLLAMTVINKDGKDGKAPLSKPAEVARPQPPQERSFLGNLMKPFAKTKWYTWVIAGGVVALVAGLMIAGRFGKDEVTVQTTYP